MANANNGTVDDQSHTSKLDSPYIDSSDTNNPDTNTTGEILDVAEANNPLTKPEQPNQSITTPFSNEQVSVDNISTENIAFVSLASNFRKMNVIFGSTLGVIALLVLALLSSNLLFDVPEDLRNFIPYAYGGIIGLTMLDVFYHVLADPLKKYALREHDINYHSGLIFKSLVSQPILRIQHIELKRGPIERKFGLATLQVFSAGGISYTFYIPGLEYDNAVKLREFILDHKDLAADV